MPLEKEISLLMDKRLDKYLDNISLKYSIPKNELRDILEGKEKKYSPSSNQEIKKKILEVLNL